MKVFYKCTVLEQSLSDFSRRCGAKPAPNIISLEEMPDYVEAMNKAGYLYTVERFVVE